MNRTFTIITVSTFGGVIESTSTVSLNVPASYDNTESNRCYFAFMALSEDSQALVVSIANGATTKTKAQMLAAIYGGGGGGAVTNPLSADLDANGFGVLGANSIDTENLSAGNASIGDTLSVGGVATFSGSVRSFSMGGGSPPDGITLRSPLGTQFTVSLSNGGAWVITPV
jgi:hypothetical protein